jgi:YD repeat-containing protein
LREGPHQAASLSAYARWSARDSLATITTSYETVRHLNKELELNHHRLRTLREESDAAVAREHQPSNTVARVWPASKRSRWGPPDVGAHHTSALTEPSEPLWDNKNLLGRSRNLGYPREPPRSASPGAVHFTYMRAAGPGTPRGYSYGGTAYANPDASTQIANGLSTTTFTHGNNGNVTQKTVDGTTTTYVYDYANRLTALGAGGATTTYAYDTFGQRALSMVSVNLFSGFCG